MIGGNKMNKLLNWTDVQMVVKTMIENRINVNDLEEDDIYLIEKLVDAVFEKVRKKQLAEQS